MEMRPCSQNRGSLTHAGLKAKEGYKEREWEKDYPASLTYSKCYVSWRQNSYSQQRPHLSWVPPIGKQHLLGVSVLGFHYR